MGTALRVLLVCIFVSMLRLGSAALVGDSCDSFTDCDFVTMRCNSNLDKCQCNSWHIETRLKACARKEGSLCSNNYPCADNMRCVSSRCVCEDGFSPTAQRSCEPQTYQTTESESPALTTTEYDYSPTFPTTESESPAFTSTESDNSPTFTSTESDNSPTFPTTESESPAFTTTELDHSTAEFHNSTNTELFTSTQEALPASSDSGSTAVTVSPDTADVDMTSPAPNNHNIELCTCACVRRSSPGMNVTTDLLLENEKIVEELKENLTLNASTLSRTLRKKTSAADVRSSSQVMGYASVAALLVVLVLLVLSDLAHLSRYTASHSSPQGKGRMDTVKDDDQIREHMGQER